MAEADEAVPTEPVLISRKTGLPVAPSTSCEQYEPVEQALRLA